MHRHRPCTALRLGIGYTTVNHVAAGRHQALQLGPLLSTPPISNPSGASAGKEDEVRRAARAR
jgi:hypothetical protein